MKVAPNQVVDSCGSTNDLARRLGESGFPHGTWISARRQEQGRGRLGRVWQGIDGNLFLSIVARLEPQALWTWIPLSAAVGVAQALRAGNPGLDLRIKWPNDLWISRAKVGGILCEGVGSAQGSFIVIGIGLNCVAAPERSQVDQEVTSLSAALGSRIDADSVRGSVIRGVLSALEELGSRGAGAIAERYSEYPALAPGTSIEWGSGLQGWVVGLGPAGELVVRSSEGKEARLFAEDVKVRLSR